MNLSDLTYAQNLTIASYTRRADETYAAMQFCLYGTSYIPDACGRHSIEKIRSNIVDLMVFLLLASN